MTTKSKAIVFLERGWGDIFAAILALVWALLVLVEWPTQLMASFSAALEKLCSWELSGGFAFAAAARGFRKLTGEIDD